LIACSTKPVPQPTSRKLCAPGKWRRSAQTISRLRDSNQKFPGSTAERPEYCSSLNAPDPSGAGLVGRIRRTPAGGPRGAGACPAYRPGRYTGAARHADAAARPVDRHHAVPVRCDAGGILRARRGGGTDDHGRRLRDRAGQRREPRRIARRRDHALRARFARARRRSVAQLRAPQGDDDGARARARRARVPDRLRPRGATRVARGVPHEAPRVGRRLRVRRADGTQGRVVRADDRPVVLHAVQPALAAIDSRQPPHRAADDAAVRRQPSRAPRAGADDRRTVGDHRVSPGAARGGQRIAPAVVVHDGPEDRDLRGLGHFLQRSPAGRDLLPRRVHRARRLRRRALADLPEAAARRRRRRLPVPHGVDLAARRADDLLHRPRRDLHVEDLPRDEAAPVHDRPRAVRAGAAAVTWVKRGRIFEPRGEYPFMASHAAVPIVVPGDGDLVRIYVSARDRENRARVCRLDFDVARGEVVRAHGAPVLDVGALGTFDDHGVVGSWIVEHAGRLHLYYAGVTLGVTVPFYFYLGLAVSFDGGETFTRVTASPVLERSSVDPYLTGQACVRIEDGRWRMWYVSGTRWEPRDGGPRHYYHIKYA